MTTKPVELKKEIRKRVAAQLNVSQETLLKAEAECDGALMLVPVEKTGQFSGCRLLNIETDEGIKPILFPLCYFVGFAEGEDIAE